ncbi:MAG TPA: hypothetical protein VI461_14560, partial [Chitinophagaceae bacterium]|nr:hypothetical protein [Chitinophagaceae bacterium]
MDIMDESRKKNQPDLNGDASLSLDDFKKSFGENFSDAIDIETWRIGENLAELYPVIENELLKAKQDEERNHQVFREKVFPRIKELQNVPHAGLHQDVDSEEIIEKIHCGFLFNGAVTACGSVSAIYETVPISITQIGICLVNYQGQHGSYSHRLYRRDLRFKSDDPIKDAFDLIEKRKSDDLLGENRAKLSTLAVRGIKTYAERAILLEKSNSSWLMASGSPTPYELMTGFWASRAEMKERSTALMRKMVLEHSRFVYVQSSTTNPLLWTFGNALKPFEYLIIDTLQDNLVRLVERGGTRGEFRKTYEKFAEEVGSKIAMGVYKV